MYSLQTCICVMLRSINSSFIFLRGDRALSACKENKKLREIFEELNAPDISFQPSDQTVSWCQEMRSAMEELVFLLKEEHTISSFELYNSGIVQTMLSILSGVSFFFNGFWGLFVFLKYIWD